MVLVPLALGVVALGVVGFLVLRGLRRDTGGAASADKAVRELATSLSSGDWAAAADLMAPDEAYDLKGLIGGLRRSAVEGGLTSNRTSNGLDVKVDLTMVTSTALGASAARVDIDGSAHWGAASTVGPVLKQLLGPSTAARSISATDAALTTRTGTKVPPFLLVVRKGDRWYVSPALTGAEYARRLFDLPAGNFDAVRAPRSTAPVAATPEAALDRVLAAVGNQDVDALADSLAAGEARVARVYRSAIDELLKRGDANRWTLAFDHLQTRRGAKSNAVEVTGLDVVTGSRTGSKTSSSFDGTCLTVDQGKGRCFWLTDDVATRLGVGRPQLRAVREGGSWKFSPLASIVDVAATAAAKADGPFLTSLLGTQFLDDGQALNLDEPVSVNLADQPYGVYDVTLAAGDVVAWEVHGGAVGIYDKRADGTWQRQSSTDLGLVRVPTAARSAPSPFYQLYRAPAVTTRRFVVTAPTTCGNWLRGCFMGNQSKPATFVVRRVSTQDIVFPGVAKGHLEPGQSILLGFAVEHDASWVPTLTGAVTVKASGPAPVGVVAGQAAPVALKAGRYQTLVTNTGAAASDFSLGFADAVTFGFDAGAQVVLMLDGTGDGRTRLHLQAGKAWTVTATPPATMDIRIQVIDYDGSTVACSFDDHPVGQPEVCAFRPAPRDGVVTVVVVPTNGVAGVVTVTAAQT